MSAALRSVLRPALAIALALAVAAVVLLAAGVPPIPALAAMARGAAGDRNGLLRTLAKATPLLFSGLAVALALRAGLFNIGAEGQLLVGGLMAAWTGFGVHGLPAPVHVTACLLAGAAAGGAWAFVPGLLKAWRGTHEVIVTIMMNYLAILLTHYLVNNPLRAPGSGAVKTPEILPSAVLWSLPGGTHFSAGLVLALAAAATFAVLVRRTALGYEIRAVGLGADAARAAGIPVARTLVVAMTLSGALAGLAGAVEVLAVHHRFLDQFSPGYGFDSIAVALLGGLSAFGVTLSALLFGGLNSGALTMEAWTGAPRQIAGVVQAVVIVAVGVRYLRWRARP